MATAMETLFEYAHILYSAPSAQLAVEISVVLFLVWTLKRGPAAQAAQTRKISDREMAEVLQAFTPEPLYGSIPDDHYSLNPRLITGRIGKHVTVDSKRMLNLATHNYLGLADREDSTEKAIVALRNYGVGSCGPRGFYGTADVHLRLEARLAEFMGVEQACLYSYGFSAIASAIPSYVKAFDVIFADEQVNFSILQGITASRSTVFYFKHNDPVDLERLLKAQDERDAQKANKGTKKRRFLILEGIYMNTGALVNLPEMVRLRAKYRCRLFIDETVSFGTLGKTGKGVREHFGVDFSEVDLVSASLEYGMSSYGGFLCGSHFLMEHQRLCGLGYCFSASLPPLQAVVSISHLDIITKEPQTCETLRSNCEKIHNMIGISVKGLRTDSHPLSPVKQLCLTENFDDRTQAQAKIDAIIKFAEGHGIALNAARYLENKEVIERPCSIKLCVSSLLTHDECEHIAKVLGEACRAIL